ncbi:PP2C family protein-serine/threonine phosphatase [Flavobacterium sp.]|uniref:PP2C family protein-serine/threonine phosphatase n=1 Tax=Flavobacterium sp. TaxID=239 RepID=UPI003B9C6CF1
MKSISFSQLGKRANQEDAFGSNSTTFIVCDGVGGHTKGEVASNFIKDFILENPIEITKLNIEKLLVDAQKALNERYGQNPETIGMGTTFCCLFFNKNNAFIAHIGDSRLYWLKPKENLVWHTWDHSIVSELVKSGEITREEGRHHPMNNRISKAIVANKENKTTTPEIIKIDKVDSGDIFFLCTDGVNEAWSDYDLITTLVDKRKSVEQKIALIQNQCELESKDNNTAIIIEIAVDDEINKGDNYEIEWLSIAQVFNRVKSSKEKELLSTKRDKFGFNGLRVLFIISFVFLIYILFKRTFFTH